MDKFLMPKNKRKEKPCHHNSQTARKRGTNSCNGESKLPDVFTYIPTLIISAGSIKENGQAVRTPLAMHDSGKA